jgi:hypothetical protein
VSWCYASKRRQSRHESTGVVQGYARRWLGWGPGVVRWKEGPHQPFRLRMSNIPSTPTARRVELVYTIYASQEIRRVASGRAPTSHLITPDGCRWCMPRPHVNMAPMSTWTPSRPSRARMHACTELVTARLPPNQLHTLSECVHRSRLSFSTSANAKNQNQLRQYNCFVKSSHRVPDPARRPIYPSWLVLASRCKLDLP